MGLQMRSSSSHPHWQRRILVGLLASVVVGPVAQVAPPTQGGPQLHAAIAASSERVNVPAIAWLCEEYLPSLPEWPEGLDPHSRYAVSLSADGLRIQATDIILPKGSVAIGSCTFDSSANTPPLLWSCELNGQERWSVPTDFHLPAQWRRLLHSLEADLTDTPRTLSVPVIIGHLAGGLLDDDPRSALLRLTPALCGDATWLAWQQGDYTHVCGRSLGGLMLPVTLLALSIDDRQIPASTLALRAFSSRDMDQAEALRQLSRPDRRLDTATLRALLHAEDPVCLAAIEALIRHRATDSLPNIVKAAGPKRPLATIAARDAVLRLWPTATTEIRHATHAALALTNSPVLGQLNAEDLPVDASSHSDSRIVTEMPTTTNGSRARALTILFFVSLGLLALWRREQVMLHRAAI